MPGLTEALEQAIAEHDQQANPDDEPAEDVVEEPEQPEEAGDDVEAEEADEPASEDDGEADDEGEEGEQPDAVAVDEEAVYTLPDGTQVQGSELRDGWLRQQDYTRKTQQLAHQRRQVQEREQQITDWLESVKEQPGQAILEVATATEQPAATFAEALAADGNATRNVAVVLRQLADQGKLDREFVDHFGIDTSNSPVGQQAEQAVKDERIEKLEQRDQQREQERRQQELVAEYHREWDSIKDESGLDFGGDQQAEQQAKVELMKFARDRQIPSLTDAYAVMERKGEGFAGRQAQQRQQQQEQTRKTASQTAEKKRKAKAQTRRGSRQQEPKPADGPRDLTGVIEKTFADKGIAD